MKDVAGRSDLVRVRTDAREFHEGMIRITKGLLFCLHPGFDYQKARFDVVDISPEPFDAQLQLMAMLKQAGTFLNVDKGHFSVGVMSRRRVALVRGCWCPTNALGFRVAYKL